MPNLRFVISISAPNSHTELFQLLGRCARDGKPGEFIQLVTKFTAPKPSKLGAKPPKPTAERFHPFRLLARLPESSRCLRSAYFADFRDPLSPPPAVAPKRFPFCCDICTGDSQRPRNDIGKEFVGVLSLRHIITAPTSHAVRNPHRVTQPSAPPNYESFSRMTKVDKHEAYEHVLDAINTVVCRSFNDAADIEQYPNRMWYFPPNAEADLTTCLLHSQQCTFDVLQSTAPDCPTPPLESVLPAVSLIAHKLSVVLPDWTRLMKSTTKTPSSLLGPRLGARPPPSVSFPLTPPQLGQSYVQRIPMLPPNSTRSISLDTLQGWNPPATPSHSHLFRPVHPSVTPMLTYAANPSQSPSAFCIPTAVVHSSMMLQPPSTPNSSQQSHPGLVHVHHQQSISEQPRFASPALSLYLQRQRVCENENHMPSQPPSQGAILTDPPNLPPSPFPYLGDAPSASPLQIRPPAPPYFTFGFTYPLSHPPQSPSVSTQHQLQ